MPEAFERGGEQATVQRIVVDHQDVAHTPPPPLSRGECFTHGAVATTAHPALRKRTSRAPRAENVASKAFMGARPGRPVLRAIISAPAMVDDPRPQARRTGRLGLAPTGASAQDGAGSTHGRSSVVRKLLSLICLVALVATAGSSPVPTRHRTRPRAAEPTPSLPGFSRSCS